jgi:hypothetical protein
MPWQGQVSWHRAYSGTFKRPEDGTVWEGIWALPANQDPPDGPPPSPTPLGLPPENDDPHQQPWQGGYDANGIWTRKYTWPDGTVFYGMMTR